MPETLKTKGFSYYRFLSFTTCNLELKHQRYNLMGTRHKHTEKFKKTVKKWAWFVCILKNLHAPMIVVWKEGETKATKKTL